jgi:hypothetical protein
MVHRFYSASRHTVKAIHQYQLIAITHTKSTCPLSWFELKNIHNVLFFSFSDAKVDIKNEKAMFDK